MTMMKKISAMAMATAMVATMAVGTALSASAADVTSTNVYAVESVEASTVTTTGKTIAWSYGDVTKNLEMCVMKTDLSEVSMADAGIVKNSVTLKTVGDNFVMTIPVQPISHSFLGTTYTADITKINAYAEGGAVLCTATVTNGAAELIFPVSSELPFVGDTTVDGVKYTNSIKLKFNTTMENSAIAGILPSAMKTPEAYALFNVVNLLSEYT